jgi:hypothetical protein
MEKVLLLAVSITILFGIMKFVEMKYLDQKLKPLKDIIRDLVMVFGSSFVCSFGLIHYQQTFDDFLNVITNKSLSPIATTQVFTGNPDF